MEGSSTPGKVAAGLRGRADFDPARAEGHGLADSRRAFTTSVRLGWQIESNWTDPLLFLIFLVARPVASALILIVMLEVISGGANRDLRAFVITGSALWSFVVAGMAGLAWSVLDDRERYRTLKYLVVSPSTLVVMLLGRGTARVASGAMGAMIAIGVGIVFLGVPFDVTRVDWGLLVPVMVVGLASIVALGLLLAATVLQSRQDSWSYPDAVAGALFLVVGAIFPLTVLPGALQAVGLLVPLTWWLEGVRQALFPGALSSIGGAGSFYAQVTGRLTPSGGEVIIVLLATTAIVTLAAATIYGVSERRARDRGLFDRTTGS
ncbi:MAG: ABC transporter permease [Chloroflexi bacterium]|nr:ABC transporter permease [Chloroflexota bacterium]